MVVEKHFNVRATADHLSLTERWVRERIKRGDIGVVRVGRRILIPDSELRRLLRGVPPSRTAAEPTMAAEAK
jgi:excisionase family DNA binding protein